eukprot:5551346-Pyramimonas_sp.AAC.1
MTPWKLGGGKYAGNVVQKASDVVATVVPLVVAGWHLQEQYREHSLPPPRGERGLQPLQNFICLQELFRLPGVVEDIDCTRAKHL